MKNTDGLELRSPGLECDAASMTVQLAHFSIIYSTLYRTSAYRTPMDGHRSF